MRRSLLLLVGLGCGRVEFDALTGDAGGDGSNLAGDGAMPDGVVVPTAANYAFVSSMQFTPADFGGVTGADQACTTLATAAGLPGSYVAWLSSLQSDVVDRMGPARGWVRPDGRPFADTVADLAALRSYFPLILDERGTALEGVLVMTNTNIDGTHIGAEDCSGYTSSAGSFIAGMTSSSASYWTLGTSYSCSTAGFVYCFGISRSTPVPAPAPIPSRLAFLTDGNWIPSSGIASADALCQSEATAAGFGARTFRALLAGVGTTAVSRFDLSGLPWLRPDNTPLFEPASDLAVSGTQRTSFNQTLTTYAPGGVFAWLGAMTPTSAGTSATTCNDWSQTNGGIDAEAISVASHGYNSVFGIPTGCTQTAVRLMCLEL